MWEAAHAVLPSAPERACGLRRHGTRTLGAAAAFVRSPPALRGLFPTSGPRRPLRRARQVERWSKQYPRLRDGGRSRRWERLIAWPACTIWPAAPPPVRIVSRRLPASDNIIHSGVRRSRRSAAGHRLGSCPPWATPPRRASPIILMQWHMPPVADRRRRRHARRPRPSPRLGVPTPRGLCGGLRGARTGLAPRPASSRLSLGL